jgi:hypothetical protein
LTLFLPRLDIEQLQESTLFFLAEDPVTDGYTLDLIVKYFLTLNSLIEKIEKHPNVEQTTLNYIRLFVSSPTPQKEISKEETQRSHQERITAIGQLTVSEKIRLAIKGNRATRLALVKDSNREVVLSVIKNPKLTDDEVEGFAQSKEMIEEALRVISRNPSWTRRYSIVNALVNNPKTPLTISLSLLKGLRGTDMEHLSKNKGVSSVIRATALKIVQIRKSGRG